MMEQKTVFMAVIKVILCAAVYLFAKIYFSLSFLMTQTFQETFPFWMQFIWIPFTSFLNKFKYHFGWKMLDLSLMTSGAGFSEVIYESDGKTVKDIKWYRANNIRSLKTAFPQYTGDVVRNWNMTVNDWLTYYVFYRIEYVPKFLITLQGEKGAKVLMTRVASALFHGVYPGFYLFFSTSAIITNGIDALRLVLPTFEDEVNIKKQSPYAIKSILLYIFWMLITVIPLDSMGVSFMEYDITKDIAMYNAVYWFPMVLTAFYFLIANILMATIGIKQTEKDKRAKRKLKAKETKKEK